MLIWTGRQRQLPSFDDIARRLDEIRRDGCDHCQGEVTILSVPSDRQGLYAEVSCMRGGTRECEEKRQRIWI